MFLTRAKLVAQLAAQVYAARRPFDGDPDSKECAKKAWELWQAVVDYDPDAVDAANTQANS